MSNAFQDAGQAIRASNPRIRQIDVLWLGFLAQKDLPPVKLPPQHPPRELATPKEETASSRISLEAEIDQFHFDEEGALERPMKLSDSEDELDRLSTAHSSKLIVARIDTSFEEEEMALNQRRSLKDLVSGRKGSSSKDASKIQLPSNPLLPPLPSPFGLLPDPNLQKKRRKGKEIEEGEFAPTEGPKTTKNEQRWTKGGFDGEQGRLSGAEVR